MSSLSYGVLLPIARALSLSVSLPPFHNHNQSARDMTNTNVHS